MGDLKVKICCIKSIDEAYMAIKAGASAIGLVGPMPSGPGVITIEDAGVIAREVSHKVETFLLTSCTSANDIAQQHDTAQTSTIQMVDGLPLSEIHLLRKLRPKVRLVQVIHVIDEQNIAEAIKASEIVDALLLDSGNPNLEIKELGGTGRTHNWKISRAIVDTVSVPVYLAGGLNSNNVVQAIESVRPFGIDLCSGVRTDGDLDVDKLVDFFTSVNGGI